MHALLSVIPALAQGPLLARAFARFPYGFPYGSPNGFPLRLLACPAPPEP